MDEDTVPYIAHSQFRSGLPQGRFHVVVNPALARPYVMQRSYMNVLLILFVAVGIGLALSGKAWVGLCVSGLGVAASRLVRHQAARIVLHLAQQDPKVYEEVTGNGVLEVRSSSLKS